MRCRYCNIALLPSRSFIDGEFCCDGHREASEQALGSQAFAAEGSSGVPIRQQVTAQVTAAIEMLRRKLGGRPAAGSAGSSFEFAETTEIPEGVSELCSMPEERELEAGAVLEHEAGAEPEGRAEPEARAERVAYQAESHAEPAYAVEESEQSAEEG